MKKRKFKLFIYLLAGATLYAACRKTDRVAEGPPPENVEEKFFSAHSSNDPLVQSINQYLMELNEKDNFIEKTIERIGYPRWDKAITVKSSGVLRREATDSTEFTYIPFVRENENIVNASLVVQTSATDTLYKYVLDWQYNYAPRGAASDTIATAEKIAATLMALDNEVFGRTRFKLLDTTLFDSYLPNTQRGQQREITVTAANPNAGGRNQLFQTIIMCVKVRTNNCNCSDPSNCDMCVPTCALQVCFDYEYDDGTGLGGGWTGGTGGTGGPGTGGGSTGGSGGYPPPECPSVATRNEVVPNCGPGWVPVPIGTGSGPSANQTIIDSLQGYPCAQGVLAQLPSINDTAKSILQNVFGVNDKVNVIFAIDSTLPPSVNASTQVNSIVFDPVTGAYKIRIRMNPSVLVNSSKEFIAKTMFHEAIHAFINYHWKKYETGLMDSVTFKTMFPKIWNFKKKPYDNLVQHTQIAFSYIDDLKSIIHAFNPLIADSVNKAIAWGGLAETQAWKNLGSDTFQLNRLRSISRDSSLAKMLSLHLKKCN